MKRTVPTSIGGAVLLGAALCVPASAQQAYRDDLKHDLEQGWKAARAFIGMWKGGTPGENVGEEHDKYIYGRK